MSAVEQIKSGNVSELDLLDYITDNDVNIAIAAAESPIATEPILDIAAHDKDNRVRFAAVSNIRMGKTTLEYLLNDVDSTVSKIAQKRLGR